MTTMPKTTIEIDSQVLEPWLDIAGILGIRLSELMEPYLSDWGDCLRDLREIGEVISDRFYETRAAAEAVAQRFEAFAIERKLSGEGDVGTVAAEVVPRNGGGWTVKAYHLSPTGKGWKSDSLIDDWQGLNDSDEE
jgi:hypothetical protein